MKVTLIKELFYLTKSKIYLVISGIIIGLLILGTFQASLNLKGAESLFVEDKQSDINFQKIFIKIIQSLIMAINLYLIMPLAMIMSN